jgi:hypothetical protein
MEIFIGVPEGIRTPDPSPVKGSPEEAYPLWYLPRCSGEFFP